MKPLKKIILIFSIVFFCLSCEGQTIPSVGQMILPRASSSCSADLLNGLILVILGNDNTTGVINDVYSFDGTEGNVVKLQSPPTGGIYSYGFNGTSSWGQIPNPFNSRLSYTISAWVYLTGSTSGHIIGDGRYDYSSVCPWIRYIGASGSLTYGPTTSYEGGNATSSYSLGLNLTGWYRIAYSISLNTLNTNFVSKLYVNGNLKKTFSGSSYFDGSGYEANFMIGCYKQGSSKYGFTAFRIAHLMMWNRILTDSEAMCDYNSGAVWYQ